MHIRKWENENDKLEKRNAKGVFGFAIFITHNSVSIAHNLKYVGPMKKKFVWICFLFLFPSLNSLIFD